MRTRLPAVPEKKRSNTHVQIRSQRFHSFHSIYGCGLTGVSRYVSFYLSSSCRPCSDYLFCFVFACDRYNSTAIAHRKHKDYDALWECAIRSWTAHAITQAKYASENTNSIPFLICEHLTTSVFTFPLVRPCVVMLHCQSNQIKKQNHRYIAVDAAATGGLPHSKRAQLWSTLSGAHNWSVGSGMKSDHFVAAC